MRSQCGCVDVNAQGYVLPLSKNDGSSMLIPYLGVRIRVAVNFSQW